MRVRTATEKDVRYLAPRLRDADRLEMQASGHPDPLEGLLDCLNGSTSCYVAVDESDLPVMIGGVAPSPDSFMGYGWMMASAGMEKHWVAILRNTHQWINDYKGEYTVLTNFVHEKNTLHIRWLRWAGFHFLRKVGINNEGFYEFAQIFTREA